MFYGSMRSECNEELIHIKCNVCLIFQGQNTLSRYFQQRCHPPSKAIKLCRRQASHKAKVAWKWAYIERLWIPQILGSEDSRRLSSIWRKNPCWCEVSTFILLHQVQTVMKWFYSTEKFKGHLLAFPVVKVACNKILYTADKT